MNKKEIINRMVCALDTFIVNMGGNVDPRSDNNKQRRLLFIFFKEISTLHGDGQITATIGECMREILDKKLTRHDFKSDEVFAVYDHLLQRLGPE